ncbi:LamG domain-containing protein [Caulobacter sp. NIBR2454]|uniref:LamG domain-containing protein n=1 Tax=Caulobacter sp. NIBR2454 TaxID=3015996 RepID=UPI0022B6B922|nr:LamG domain-containing protein [Caulobacter sp. NIBR2454]
MFVRLAILLAAFSLCSPAVAGSLRFAENRPEQYDFADLARLPPEFGRGEFSFELWIKPDAGYPVGPVYRASKAQLRNWSDADPKPYSSPGWWLTGNWLLDGHTRPEGYTAGATREGTFSLQFYGGGRLRWMFADDKVNASMTAGEPQGSVYAVQAWPAATTPSLLDDKWHHVVAVRRWRAPEGATLELWIDGARVAATDIATRTDMRRFWDQLAHPRDPKELGGWAFGSEVMTAWDYEFTQYEDYKGLVDALRLWGRALTPEQIAAAAKGGRIDRTALLGRYGFDEGRGDRAVDALNPNHEITLHRMPLGWSPEDAPARD